MRLLLFCSLIATAVSAQNQPQTRVLTDLAQLEGRYNIIAIHDTANTTLDWMCLMEPRLDRRYFRDKKCAIEIKKTRNKQLSFILWDGENKKASSHMRARLKDGIVYARRTKIRVFTLVFNIVNGHHAKMALTEDGDLLVKDITMGGCGLIVFFPLACAGEHLTDMRFERAKVKE